jgi:hypothetical protein
MKPGKISISKPDSGATFLWKYIDLHRFIYLLTEQKLFFTRLDKFEDPYEGVATKLLRRDAKYSKVSLDINKLPNSLTLKQKKQLINEKKLHDYLKNQEIEKAQNRQYVSCWFACDRESMAMWNLYSSSNSVALKFDFNRVTDELTKSFSSFISKNGNRLSILGAEVTYLRLNPFDEKLPKQKLKYSAFKKDISFQYEKEYRFLIVTVDNLDRVEPFYSIPIDIKNLNMTVIAHPNMEAWQFENLKKLLALTDTDIKIEKSSTLLRNKNYG